MAIRVGQKVKVCLGASLRGHPVQGAVGVVQIITDDSASVLFTPMVRASGGREYPSLWLGLNTLLPIHPRMPISPIFLQETNDATV